MKPEAGGEYVFLRDAYGRLWSFLFGWMQIFIAKTGFAGRGRGGVCDRAERFSRRTS